MQSKSILHPHSGWFYVSRASRAQQAKALKKSLRPNTGTEARLSYLLTAVAGGFAMTFIRKETQEYSAALKSAGQSPIGLLPLDGRRRLWRNVVRYAVHTGNLTNNARRNTAQELIR